MSDWHEVTLGDLAAEAPNALATGPFGSAISSKHFIADGVPVIRGSNLSRDVGVRLSDRGLAFLNEGMAEQFRRSVARRGDLVFTCWGTVGQVGLIDERCQFDEYVVSNKQMKLTPNPDRVDSHFLYYLLSSPQMVGEVTGQAIGAAVPGFNLGQLRSLTVRLPELQAQRSIAAILRALDDLIENNRRRVELLEEMARAIYREWFVRFRYPGYEDVPLVDSALGPIPDGWTPGVLGDLAALDRLNIQPAKSPAELFDHYSIPAFDDGQRPAVDAGATIKSSKYLLSSPAVLVSKLNPRIDRVWFAEPVMGRRSVTSTEFLLLRPRERSSLEHLYLLARGSGFRNQLTALSGGTSGSHQRAKPADFLNLPVLIPPLLLVHRLADAVGDHLRHARSLRSQSHLLTALRDFLLPKLVSGQIDMSQLDALTEDAIA